MLAESESIMEMISNQNFQKLLQCDNAKKTGMLLAAWMGNTTALKFLLNNGASVHVVDKDGR